MNKEVIIKVENLSKQYRLGEVGTGTISNDITRWWHTIRGKEDPFLKIGEANDRSRKGNSDYVWSLKNITFEVERGQTLGIIGKNGAGKSTLLKILSQITSPTTGKIGIKGRIASLLEVGTGFHPQLTGRENIFLNGAILGMSKTEIKNKFDEIVDFSGVERYIDTPVKRYSSGMYVRLAFAVAAHLEPEILIVDEVLAVGDAEFQKKCIGKMKDVSGQGRTVLFVSHNMPSIKSLCSRGIVLKNGSIDFDGNILSAIDKYFDSDVKMKELGVIPDNFERLYSTGEAKIKRVAILNGKGEATSEVFFNAPIKIKIEIHVEKTIPQALIDVLIGTKDGIVITHSINTLNRKEPYTLEKGKHAFEVTINNPMQAGLYSLTCGIHHVEGTTIDYLVNFYDFYVLKVAEGSNEDFKWNSQHGYVRLDAEWKKIS